MSVRLNAVGLFAAATLITACGPDRITEEDGGQDAGCTGACNEDAGQDGGGTDALCANVSNDGGTVTLDELRALPACGQIVYVPNVVVHTVTFERDSGTDFQAEFYVGPSDGGSGPGVFVDKFYSDAPTNYLPKSGHKVNLRGFLYENYRRDVGIQHTSNMIGYRREVGAQFGADGGAGKLQITFLNANNPVDVITVDESFSAQGGTVAARPEYLGRRVHFPGPVYVQDATPLYMREWNLRPSADGGQELYVKEGRNYWQGYELTGGVVVHDRPFRFDCGDYRQMAADAGDGKLFFPDGVSGVWETYTMSLYVDECPGSTDYKDCMRPGFIPAEDGGVLTTHINVIVPFDCNDVDGGVVDAGP